MRPALICCVLLLLTGAALLAQPADPTPPTTQPTTRPAARVTAPLIEPTQSPDDGWGRPTSTTLRREGDFVARQTGRLTPAGDGKHYLFVFDTEPNGAKQTPMVLLPSRMLEEIELFLKERGEQPVSVSGQITLYRGTNYLMLTGWQPVGVAATQPDPVGDEP